MRKKRQKTDLRRMFGLPEKKKRAEKVKTGEMPSFFCTEPLDTEFLLLVITLTVIGLIMLFSASYPVAMKNFGGPYYFLWQQGKYALVGIALMIGISYFNYDYLRPFGVILLVLSFMLLVLVLFFGVVRNNARRWLNVFGLFQFQPSEVAKLAVVLFFSDSISRKKALMHIPKYGILPYGIILAVLGFLMWKEPHLSGMIIIFGVGAVLLFAGGVPWRYVLIGLAAVGGGITLLLSGAISYGQSRIAMWPDPFIDATGEGYQMAQSLIAIGSGGLWGLGLGQSRQKFLFLPEVQNDFIFSIVAEELGFVGAGLILLIFAALIIRGYLIAMNAKNRFGSLLCIGITTLLAMQTFLNIAVVSDLIPATGISLPFFSSGGTALILQLVEMGIVLSVSRQCAFRVKREEKELERKR